jgi:hypothetical protein
MPKDTSTPEGGASRLLQGSARRTSASLRRPDPLLARILTHRPEIVTVVSAMLPAALRESYLPPSDYEPFLVSCQGGALAIC